MADTSKTYLKVTDDELPDYDALAKQHGAVASAPAGVDYDALAKQHGAVSSAPAAFQLKPGLPDDQIIRHYGYDPEVIKKAKLYSPGDLSGSLDDPNRNDLIGKIGDTPIGDMGYGVLGTAHGIAQLATHGLHALGAVSDADQQYMDLLTRVAKDNYEQNTRKGHPGAIGQMIGAAMVPIPGVGLKAGGSLLANGARLAATGAIMGGTQPVEVEGPDGSYWKDKALQATEGAAIAPAVHGAVTGAGKGIVAGVDLLRGGGKIPAAAQELLGQAAQHGVDGLTYGDVTGNKAAQTVDTTLESLPFLSMGAGAQRARQQTQVKTAAQRIADALRDTFLRTTHDGIEEIQQAAASGDKGAKDVLDLVQNAGDDPDKALQASLAIRNYRTLRQNQSNYNRVGAIADTLADNHVRPAETIPAIDAVTSELDRLKLGKPEVTRLRSMFTTLRGNIGGDSNSYNDMRRLSDMLGEDISTYYEGKHAAVGEPGVQWLQRVKTAVDNDLRNFTRQSGNEAASPASVSVSEGPAAAGTNAGTTQQGAATPQPNRPGAPSARSEEAIVTIPGEATKYNARYELRELGDLQPSHNGQTFQPNPRYPIRNDRNYGTPANQRKVVEWSGETFDPAYHITDNPDATNGPPLIDLNGTVLGGNGRTMIMDRVYANNPKGAAAYRAMLEDRAAHFGIDPAEVGQFKQPVLVRVIDDTHLDGPKAYQDAVTNFNKTGTAALTPAEQAIADARRVSPETLEHIAQRMRDIGPDATLADAIEGKAGVQLLRRLESDGVISPQAAAGLAGEEELTRAGKQRVSQLMLGRYFTDPEQIDNLAASVRNKIERIAAPLAKIEGEPKYSLTPHVQEAIGLLEQQRAHGAATIDDYLNQKGMFAQEQYAPEAIQLARELQHTNPVELTDKIRKYGEHADYAGNYQGPGMFGDIPDPHTPRQAFNDAFGTKLSERTDAPAAPIETPRAPAPSADFEAAFKRPENDAATLAKLRRAAEGADRYFERERVPFQDRMIANSTKTDEPDQIFSKFVQAGKGDRAQKFYNMLDDRGQAAVRYGIVSNAIETATDSSTGIFSPKKFVSALEKTTDAQGVFFKGKDKWEMDGFRNLMQHVTRAGQYAENPPNGQRLATYILGGSVAQGTARTVAGMFGHGAVVDGVAAGAGAIGATMIGAARVLFTTPAGRNFLLAASSARPGSAAMAKLVEQINSQLPAAAAREAGAPSSGRGKAPVYAFPSAADQTPRTGTR